MLTITKRMQTIQEELPQLICILQEGINLTKEISQSTEGSPERKLDYIRYLFLYYNRIQSFRSNVLELKPEVIMLEQKVETMFYYGEGSYQQARKIMEDMLTELKNLPICKPNSQN